MAGQDPDRILQLPDTAGMKDEILIYKKHRFGFEICYRTAGAKIKEWGRGEGSLAEQLSGALNEDIAAVTYVCAPGFPCDLSLREVVAIAHEHEVPVIVDGAAMLPPADNLTKYIADGADLVTFSGRKGVRRPQSTGILAGRADVGVGNEVGGIYVSPVALEPGEAELVAEALSTVLRA